MTKIEWTDFTFNPVWGCLSKKCPYCYARKISKRYAKEMSRMKKVSRKRLEEFLPTEIPDAWNKTFTKKSSRVFVGSMSDIAFWEKEWLYKLKEYIKKQPQHTYQLLTKYPSVYKRDIFKDIVFDKVWFGVSVTGNKDIHFIKELIKNKILENRIRYVSYEPVFSKLNYNLDIWDNIDWVILGAASKYSEKTDIKHMINFVVGIKDRVKVFVKQIPHKKGVEKNINKFPEELKRREFPL